MTASGTCNCTRSVPIVGGLTLTNPGSGYTAEPLVTITNAAGDTTGKGATAKAIVDLTAGSPTLGQVVGLELITVGSGYTSAPSVTIAPPTAGTTATASATHLHRSHGSRDGSSRRNRRFPGGLAERRTRGRSPRPGNHGPQISSRSVPRAASCPGRWLSPTSRLAGTRTPPPSTSATSIGHGLLLGPAERADVIVDFSAYAGKTLILYNDAPAAFPALDPRLDYYTNAPDHAGHRRGDLASAGLRSQHADHHADRGERGRTGPPLTTRY